MIATRPKAARRSAVLVGRSSLVTATLLLCGVTGVVAGIGVGLGRLRAGLVTWESILAGIALMGGLACLGLCVVRLGHSRPMWARSLIRLLVLLLSAVVIWTLVPAVFATVVPPYQRSATPEDFGLVLQDVQFTAGGGVDLAGWFSPPSNGVTVIIRHGSGSTASDVLPQARVLARHGYGLLITDARGHGQSEGRGMDFGWNGESDIRAAVDFLVSRPEVDPGRIAVLGMSMGGEEAVGAAGADSRIAAVVAEGATARTAEDKAWLPIVYGWRGSIQIWLERAQYAVTDLLTDAPKPIPLREAAIRADPTPIMLIAAGGLVDEVEAVNYIEGPGGNVTVWIVPGAGHTQGLSIDPGGWERTVIDFLDTATG